MTDSTSLEHNTGHLPNNCAASCLAAALVVAVIGTAGSVYLSMGLGLKACPLCFYQRSFVMAVLAVLALGRFVERSRPGLICLLSVPPTWAGLGVAAYDPVKQPLDTCRRPFSAPKN